MKILGHKNQWQFLRRSAESNRIPHAFLFCGQEKLGKKTLALEFIKFLNCQNKKSFAPYRNEVSGSGPCQTCRSCQDIQKKQHPDLAIVEPQKKEIQIPQIRELSRRLSLRSYSAPFKAAIIDQAHSMNQEAQSAFLKTLEEPKGNTLLILITEYPEALFSTILSRVQKIKFYPVQKSEIEDYLKNQGLSLKKAQEITSLSLGRPGQAIDFLNDPQKLENQKQRLLELFKISQSDLAFRFQYAKNIAQEPQNLKEILDTWLSYFRSNLLSAYQSQKYPQKYSLSRLKKILRLIQSTNYLISTTNINPRLALEILMLEL